MMTERFDLQRFVTAQAGAFPMALAEIQRGRKRGHWMWFVFPQISGLGSSETAHAFAIGSLSEAKAYLDHPLLGARLRECLAALQDLPPTTPEVVFGELDARKLRSSLTLFIESGGGALFQAALDRWFEGRKDVMTLKILADQA
jgi:uncharacterized protein (DUF1810 family)